MPSLWCVACGAEGPGVHPVLSRWRDPLPGRPFEVVPRCVDRVRCREHTEAQGDEWPFADAGEKVGKQ